MSRNEAAEPTAASIVVDQILADAVSDVLECKETHK